MRRERRLQLRIQWRRRRVRPRIRLLRLRMKLQHLVIGVDRLRLRGQAGQGWRRGGLVHGKMVLVVLLVGRLVLVAETQLHVLRLRLLRVEHFQ